MRRGRWKWQKETRILSFHYKLFPWILSFHYKLENFISFKDNESRKQQTQQQSCDTTKQERPSCFRDTTDQERHSYFRDTTNQQRHNTWHKKTTKHYCFSTSVTQPEKTTAMLHYVMNTTPENNKINMRTTTHKNNKQKQKPEMCSPFGNITRNYTEPPDTEQK